MQRSSAATLLKPPNELVYCVLPDRKSLTGESETEGDSSTLYWQDDCPACWPNLFGCNHRDIDSTKTPVAGRLKRGYVRATEPSLPTPTH